ncbi:MAG: transcriptional repressor [Dehalococcoidia bacterium]|jgi:Fe2+ or Zn2+ uptake regulation protein
MLQAKKLSGRRMTSQRKLLFDLLNECGGHVDAGELYVKAREKDPRISLATVYRNLSLFKQAGLVKEYHFAEEHHHYEVKGKRGHQHLVCLGCGKLVEFESPLVTQIKEDTGKANDFFVTDVTVYIEGYCADCYKVLKLLKHKE